MITLNEIENKAINLIVIIINHDLVELLRFLCSRFFYGSCRTASPFVLDRASISVIKTVKISKIIL